MKLSLDHVDIPCGVSLILPSNVKVNSAFGQSRFSLSLPTLEKAVLASMVTQTKPFRIVNLEGIWISHLLHSKVRTPSTCNKVTVAAKH